MLLSSIFTIVYILNWTLPKTKKLNIEPHLKQNFLMTSWWLVSREDMGQTENSRFTPDIFFFPFSFKKIVPVLSGGSYHAQGQMLWLTAEPKDTNLKHTPEQSPPKHNETWNNVLWRVAYKTDHAIPTKFDTWKYITLSCVLSNCILRAKSHLGYHPPYPPPTYLLNYSVGLTLWNTGQRTVTYYVPFPEDIHGLSLLPSASLRCLF